MFIKNGNLQNPIVWGTTMLVVLLMFHGGRLSFAQTNHSLNQLGHFDAVTTANDVDVMDGIAYMATDDGLVTVDVSDPSNPVLLGSVSTPDGEIATEVTVTENTAYLNADEEHVMMVDVSDPANPTLLGHSFSEQWRDSLGAFQIYLPRLIDQSASDIPEDTLFFANRWSASVDVIDVSDPSAPTNIDRFSMRADAIPDVGNGIVSGNIMYATFSYALVAVDVSDPSNLTLLDTVEMLESRDIYNLIYDQYGSSNRVLPVGNLAVSGNMVYTTQYDQNEQNFMMVIDATDPTDLVLLGSVASPVSQEGYIVPIEDTVYIGNSRSLKAVDVSDPTNPVVLGSVDTTESIFPIEGIDVAENMLYVASGESGLFIYEDVSLSPTSVDVSTAETYASTMSLLIIATFTLVLYTIHLRKPKTTLTP